MALSELKVLSNNPLMKINKLLGKKYSKYFEKGKMLLIFTWGGG